MFGLSELGVGLVRAALLCVLLLALSGEKAGVAQGASPPAAPKQTIAEKIAASKGLLDINTATPEQLRALPGMGDAYVQRVIAGRPYSAKNQLTTRGVIPAAEYERIREMIIAHRVKSQ
jgi:competence protein ComEA